MAEGRHQALVAERDPRHVVRGLRRGQGASSGSARLGVRFTRRPVNLGPVTTAVPDDTCGNLIQIASMN